MSIRVSWDADAGELVMGGKVCTPAEVGAAVRDYERSAEAAADRAAVDRALTSPRWVR